MSPVYLWSGLPYLKQAVLCAVSLAFLPEMQVKPWPQARLANFVGL